MEEEVAQKEMLQAAAAEIRAEAVKKEEARPKTVGAGALGLVGDSLSGVAVGAAAIVMGPVAGYKEGGASGMLKGAVGGLCVGVASAALGIGSGVVKLVDGAAAQASDKNLPAIEAAPPDADAHERYAAEKARLYEGLLDDSDGTAGPQRPPPSDTELYDVLGIRYDATPKEIRKAYFVMAQRNHPDKNPGDETATARFQRISDAYQILSDPDKRERYDRMGKEANEDQGGLDPHRLFALMFSGDKFDHLVGDLATATLLNTSAAEDAANQDHTAELRRKAFQGERVRKLAELLRRRLAMWEGGQRDEFLVLARLEIQVLRTEPFGADILHTVGTVYRRRAALEKSKSKGPFGIKGMLSELSDKAYMMRSKVEAIEGGMRAAQSVHEMPDDNEELETAHHKQGISLLGAVWYASVVDIQTTLRKVVKEVMSDGGDKEKQRIRAEGLSTLGKLFQQA